MADAKVFKALGEFLSYEEKIFGDVVKYEIQYKQPNGADPNKVWKHQAKEEALSDAAIDIIANASAGERYCFHIGKDGQYPCITDITDAKDAPAKSSSGSKYGKKDYTPKDDSGIAVGAAWTNAIEILKAGLDINDVAELVEAILAKKLAQEDKLRANKKAKGDDKKEDEKPKTRAQLAKEKKEAEAKAEPPKSKASAKKKDPEPEPEEDDIQEQETVDEPDLVDDDLEDVAF